MDYFNLYILLIFICAKFVNSIPIDKDIAASEIIYYQEAGPNEFPWQVSLQAQIINTTEVKSCGGTLLSIGNNSWIITAGQCVVDMENIILGLGSNKIDEPKIIAGASEIIINPGFKQNINEAGFRQNVNDLALIKLNITVNLTDSVQPIYLPTHDQIGLSFEGVKGLTSGWGLNESKDASSQPSECLNWQEMSVISNTECRTVYGSIITKNALCARSLSGGNVCGSDFGGPLVFKEELDGWKILAVISHSQGCNSTDPAVFGRITSYMEWISKETGIEIRN